MQINSALQQLSQRQDLTAEHSQSVLLEIMRGEATPAQIGAFLLGLASKGETAAEILGGARALRDLLTPVELDPSNCLDTCGTGGDGKSLFNISTACAFVVAAAGGKVAKHGNKAVSGNSGSADVLQAAGANINLSPEQLVELFQRCGVCFMFAPLHHQALKNVAAIRRELGVRTLFNTLGPLANPARVRRQIVGVFSTSLQKNYGQVLTELGCEHALIVHSQDGLDEISSVAPSACVEVQNGASNSFTIHPADYGVEQSSLESIRSSDVQQSLELLQQALRRQHPGAYDIVRLNAGAGLYVGGNATSIAAGVAAATETIDTGAAIEKFEQYVELSQELAADA